MTDIWSEKDDAAINSIIVNIINQKKVFSDLSSNSILSDTFNIQNHKAYRLGLFTGVVINLFANYWINEHETGLSHENLRHLHKKIADARDLILTGLLK